MWREPTTLNECVYAQVTTTDKEKEELLEKIAKLEREKSEKSVEAELLKHQVHKTLLVLFTTVFIVLQVISLQDRRISDGIMVAEAPFELSVPRPETRELDDIIKALESQIEDLGVPDEGTVTSYHL